MRVASLFAGIGGFDLALTRNGHEIVYVNEWDKYAAQTYEKNFKTRPDTRSITDVPTREIPDHDLLVGGFPCQSFSVAGKRRGFEDTRGTLFFEICRILRVKRPAYLLLENVKGLFSHNGGETFYTIIRSLDELGYDCEWQVLNSKNFGVPQNRERVYIIGNTRGKSRPKVFPITGSNRQVVEVGKSSQQRKEKFIKTRYLGQNGSLISDSITLQSSEIPHIIHNIYGGFKEKKLRFFSDYSPTIRTPKGGGHIPTVIQGTMIRRLTPIECERLQGFPDNWTEGVSDNQRYKQLGNAVTVNVVEEIIKKI